MDQTTVKIDELKKGITTLQERIIKRDNEISHLRERLHDNDDELRALNRETFQLNKVTTWQEEKIKELEKQLAILKRT